jgi:predicted KAP-like P-loop ATPase
MQVDLHTKLQAMLWDIPEDRRSEVANKIMTDPVHIFRLDDQLFIKALNSLKWYELTKLISKQNLLSLLTDSTIQKLYPVQRRIYYTNARRLLSKYFVPASGQGS